jgi:Xaa-Pro dipeptidase
MRSARPSVPGNRQALPFSIAEFRRRLAQTRTLMRQRDIDLLILTGPENIYYLTGQTTGYYVYQALLVPCDGEPLFVVRKFELSNVQTISWIRSGRPVEDWEDPLDATYRAVEACGAAGGRLGFEDRGFFLPPAIVDGLRSRLPRAEFVPASGLVEECRLIKSPGEIEYIRQAAATAVTGIKAGIAAIRPGRTENVVAGSVYHAMAAAGSEYPSSQPYVVTGPRAALGHATFAGHRIRNGHNVFLEVGGCIRRYGGAIMRTVAVGKPSENTTKAAAVVVKALEAAIAAIRPGATSRSVDEAGRRLVDGVGLGKYWLHRTGYSIGLGFPPGWGEGHIFDLKPHDERRLQAGMTFHLVPNLLIPGIGAIGFSETVLVTKTGCEVLTHLSRRLVLR